MSWRPGTLLRCTVFALALLAPGAAPAQDEAARRQAAIERNDRAVALYREGELDGALTLLREALALAPDEAAVRRNAALCLVGLGDRAAEARRFGDAARDYHEAGTLWPEDPLPAWREAWALAQDRRGREALPLLERLLARWPDHAAGHSLLGQVRYDLGELAAALSAWERALQLDPADERARAGATRARREVGVEGDLVTDLAAPHFRIQYDGASDAALGRLVARELEEAYVRVGHLLGRYPPGEVAVVIYPAETFRVATGAHAWVAGLYDGKIRVPARGLAEADLREVRRVLTHEYAHALLFAVGGGRLPAWLQEGFAQVAQGRDRADARRDLTRAGAPTLAELSGSFTRQADPARARLLYAAACDLVHALLAQGGTPNLVDLLERFGRGEPLADAFRAVYGLTLDEAVEGWRTTLP